MKTALLVLTGALWTAPLPVSAVGGLWNSDGTITLNWVLPVDPTITGIRITRQRLDTLDDVVVNIPGLTTSYTDLTTSWGTSYRYWVQTVNATGELSTSAFLEFVSGDSHTDHSHWFCFVSAAAGPAPLTPALLGIAALSVAAFRRRRR